MPKGPAGRDSVHRTSEAVGDAWSWLVLREAILYDVRRFAEFQGRLGIARSTLSARLGQLVDGGLLVRGPAGQEYLLTDAGRDFFGCLMAALAWGDRWCSGGAPPPLAVTHLGCGRPADPEPRCGGCGLVIHAAQVRPEGPPRRLDGDRHPRRSAQRHRAPGYELLERARPCSIARAQAVMGDWWSGLVIREAFYGVHRFDEFHANLDVATNILSSRLTRLVEHGILDRTPYQDRPPRHEYRLTTKGLDLYPVPLAIILWGDRWKSPEGPPIPLVHLPCGHRLGGVLSCGGCGEPITRDDVSIADHVPGAVRLTSA